MLPIKAWKYLSNTKIFKDDEIKSFFEQKYFLEKKMNAFSSICSTVFPGLSIPPEIFILIIEYEDVDNNLHDNFKCSVSPKLLSKFYSPSTLILFKLLRITSNVMCLTAFAWYLNTWHDQQNALYRSIRDRFVAGIGIRNIKPVPPDFDSKNINLPFSEKLSRIYGTNPFEITKPTVPLSKYLILPFPPTPNTTITCKYWKKKYNLLAFVIAWYLFEVFHNYIVDRAYNDFADISKYLKPKYSNTTSQQITNDSSNNLGNNVPEMDETETAEMSGTLQKLYWKWRCLFHNSHHERFVTARVGTGFQPLKPSQYLLSGNCLVAAALLHTSIVPFSQMIGYVFKTFNFYNARYFFLNANTKWYQRIAYYFQSVNVYVFKFSSVLASCCLAAAFWWSYPVRLGMSGLYCRFQRPAMMLCRNQMRNRHKNMYAKLMLILALFPYANNFATLFAVFCYGLCLGESIEHLVDSESQFRIYQNYRRNLLAAMQYPSEVIDKMRMIISKQYDHKPIARLIPLLLHITSIILTYSLIGTPERLQIQAVRAYKSRKFLSVMGMSTFMLGLIGHLGNSSYITSGYYYHFPKTYSFKDYNDDIKNQTIEYHPPPRDLFECFSFGLIVYEEFLWKLYDKFLLISNVIHHSINQITTRFDPS